LKRIGKPVQLYQMISTGDSPEMAKKDKQEKRGITNQIPELLSFSMKRGQTEARCPATGQDSRSTHIILMILADETSSDGITVRSKQGIIILSPHFWDVVERIEQDRCGKP